MKCHYEVLNVTQSATDDDLKKAYRKLALKWHPDKNPESTDEAKEQFQLIQQAYDILTDPQERSWYDAHREAILKGGLGKEFVDDSLNVHQYFTTTCYKGYSDDENSFYSVYREVFKQLASEEVEYHCDDDSDFEIPEFGFSNSSYSDIVHPFYCFWLSFSTRRSFSWLDEFDTRTVGNRKVSRLMEKENKKIRESAKKDRNEEIRALVAFVRKRDRRVQEHIKKLEEKSAANAKRLQEQRLKQLKQRREEIAAQKESDWSKFSNFEKELEEIEANLVAQFKDASNESNESDNENESSPFYCPACNKLFKTEKAFTNHEKSKKHKERVEIIQNEMREEDDMLGKNTIEEEDDMLGKNTIEEEDDMLGKNTIEEEDDMLGKNTREEEEENILGKNTREEDMFEKNTSEEDLLGKNTSDTEQLLTSESDSEILITKKKKKDKKKKLNLLLKNEESAMFEFISLKFSENKNSTISDRGINEGNISENCNSDEEHKPKKSKSKRNRSKKQFISDPLVSLIDNSQTQHMCKVCSSVFKSNNELFKHLKTSGHAVPLADMAEPTQTSSKSKKRSKK